MDTLTPDEKSLSATSTHGVPPFEKNTATDNPLLLVFLTDLGEGGEAALVERFEDAIQETDVQVSTWHPSPRVLEQIAHQGPHMDSQANIHAVAILAHRAGWDGLLVADDLTKRQLHGTLRVGDDPMLSVVMVATRPRPSATTQENGVRVIAKRTTGSAPDNAKLLHTLRTFEPEEKSRQTRDAYKQCGAVLHDPEHGVFTPDTTQLAREVWLGSANQTLSKNTPLPVELVTNITSHAGSDTEPPAALPSWVHHDSQHLNIFILFPTTTDKLSNIQSTLDDAARICHENETDPEFPQMPITLIPWNAVSRQQLMNLWEGYQLQLRSDKYAPAIYFLLKPIESATDIQLGTFFYEMKDHANISHQRLDEVIWNTRLWDMHYRKRRQLNETGKPNEYKLANLETDTTELMYPPSQPFYPNPPQWCPTKRGLNWISLFYLTNNITPEHNEAITTEIPTLGEVEEPEWGDKISVTIPWANTEADGTLDDVWKIFWEIHTHQRGKGIRTPIFFVDQQTLVDNTVLAVEHDYYFVEDGNTTAKEMLKDVPFPDCRGFLYGRVAGRDAHIIYANLSIGNMDFEEFTEKSQYPRPDWPGHGILKDEEEDE
ncbi:hypothetical protein BO71DRAFT_401468 [Aspergillus ellipticus CBS 707.79]|uniref:DUF6924 domain-containing protein n=1 Tax=Aspergillus ellipticus CBS 707.79 TaxID=1448320 RepID=A0A319D2F4_9EURO|nr:hypothetical protein BO71DRAFT_401468 [Aspergillus ellipticus CBS 707.79]